MEEVMSDKIDIRAELHTLKGHLRNNRIIDAYDLLNRMSKQMDDEYYNNIISKKPIKKLDLPRRDLDESMIGRGARRMKSNPPHHGLLMSMIRKDMILRKIGDTHWLPIKVTFVGVDSERGEFFKYEHQPFPINSSQYTTDGVFYSLDGWSYHEEVKV
jgi:hypothetical protein